MSRSTFILENISTIKIVFLWIEYYFLTSASVGKTTASYRTKYLFNTFARACMCSCLHPCLIEYIFVTHLYFMDVSFNIRNRCPTIYETIKQKDDVSQIVTETYKIWIQINSLTFVCTKFNKWSPNISKSSLLSSISDGEEGLSNRPFSPGIPHIGVPCAISTLLMTMQADIKSHAKAASSELLIESLNSSREPKRIFNSPFLCSKSTPNLGNRIFVVVLHWWEWIWSRKFEHRNDVFGWSISRVYCGIFTLSETMSYFLKNLEKKKKLTQWKRCG